MSTEQSVDSIRVRMYRHGFGDCFLLSYLAAEERVFSMLIDCGIKLNTKRKEVPIEDVIRDLTVTLTPKGGKRPHLDVLVATHEHWDHVAFFHPEAGEAGYFSGFDIDQVWLAWTEDPADREAVQINSRLRQAARALKNAVKKLEEVEGVAVDRLPAGKRRERVRDARRKFRLGLSEVAAFYGVSSSDVTESGIRYRRHQEISLNSQEAMENVVALGKKTGTVRYFSPGTMVNSRFLPEGVRVYVLGPPRSGLINKSNPSGHGGHETYLGLGGPGLAGFMQALMGLAGAEPGSDDGNPFGRGHGMSVQQAEKTACFQRTYFAPDQSHRRIDESWLDVAANFALQLDGAVNNTSLVLAIEIVKTGNVLLFPGDAQVGSWLSWHDHTWKVRDSSSEKTITAEELLNRTVLYKVSHHGSHNATLREKGLELMTHPELVALIPEKEQSYSGILHPPLVDALEKQCRGRVIVSADEAYPPEQLREKKPSLLSAAEWKQFRQKLTVEKHFVEYLVE
jgi:hypothetical protein